MFTFVEDDAVTEKIQSQYTAVTDQLQQILQDLHPTTLVQGFPYSISELSDGFSIRQGTGLSVQVDIPPTDARFDPTVELHVFRIIEQASENVLRHSQSDILKIYGKIKPDRIRITVADEGDGFELDPGLDRVNLLENKHFGLAGMIERAALINAELEIRTEPHRRTSVTILWCRN